MSSITEIIEKYEALRSKNEALKKQRIEEVYAKLPEIKTIDEEINSKGFEIASNIFKLAQKGIDPEDFIAKKQIEIEKLKQKKAIILTEKGYPVNYMDIQYECEKCRDTGYIGNNKCNCLKQKIINLYFKQSNLAKVLDRENFKKFNFNYYSDVKSDTYGLSPRERITDIHARCVSFCETFGSHNLNMLFTGSPGLGKTFLCNCIALEVLRKEKSVVYNTSTSLIDTIRTIKYTDKDKAKLDYIVNCDLLIIDDLGTENITASSQSEIFNILNERLLRKKNTIISTNLSLDELYIHYDKRIVSRIIGNFELCEFFGKDIRLIINTDKKKNGS